MSLQTSNETPYVRNSFHFVIQARHSVKSKKTENKSYNLRHLKLKIADFVI